MLTLETKQFSEAKKIFTDYLIKNNQRKTQERYAVLEEIYDREDHFDAETLFISMKERNFHVSRATVYNTLELLVACGLVIKHQFGKNIAHYEKGHGFKQHDHLICNECGKVMEFCDPRIHQIKAMIGKLMEFNITGHSLNLFGNCNKMCEYKKGKAKTSTTP